MKRVISLSLGEVVLKGKNRQYFIRRILQNIKTVLDGTSYVEIQQEMGKINIEIDPVDETEIIDRLKYVFGTVYISPTWEIKSDFETIVEESVSYIKGLLKENPRYKTFKVMAKRGDKSYPMNSQEINMELGGRILEAIPALSVDVHHPDIAFHVDVKKKSYIYHEKISTYGGLPLGSNGRGLLLLSGGIDSPVAGFLMAKRGVQMDALHFHSYPFTSQKAEEKVMDLARVLCRYTTKMTMYSVNLLNIQKEINKNCPPDQMTVLSRRFMMRIANEIARRKGYVSITTGENLGQVASQTLHGLTVTDNVAEPIVFRPLIGMDKLDIISWATKIGTYDISIQPFEDCCTVFLPKHPSLRPTVEEMEESESVLDVDTLVKEAVDSMEIHRMNAKETL
ncbi:tRNA 4-thiouridine(8) synthase ThiI [Peptoniphilus sp. KCTC 25270]|uniref:tRNA uracil 4-sulfurtransferase ThiI n=1 Tax=Peptoniphilus sp. KCTC 25270 TaxID=2897414 RepID=UPI001E60EBFE|nr:tRNA 4-thiouridine(8) synthase ThiI [Peptoniphilus sp. KCTC 25270]